MANRLSIIIPAYNEEKKLAAVSRAILQSFPSVELIICNDGSTDGSSSIIMELGSQIKHIYNAINKGKGFSVRQGMLAATGDYIIFTDADLPFGIEGINRVKEKLDLGCADIVICEKVLYQKSNIYFALRKLMRGIIFLLFRFPYNDTQAGLKGFKRNAAKEIFKNSVINGFAIDVEILWIAKKKLMNVETIKLVPLYDEFRKSSFIIRNGFLILINIFKIRLKNYT